MVLYNSSIEGYRRKTKSDSLYSEYIVAVEYVAMRVLIPWQLSSLQHLDDPARADS